VQLRLTLDDPRSKQGHGSRACYTRGCREPQCVRANTAYMADYRAGRRGTVRKRQGGYRIDERP
jgi:hypothetical protein